MINIPQHKRNGKFSVTNVRSMQTFPREEGFHVLWWPSIKKTDIERHVQLLDKLFTEGAYIENVNDVA